MQMSLQNGVCAPALTADRCFEFQCPCSFVLQSFFQATRHFAEETLPLASPAQRKARLLLSSCCITLIKHDGSIKHPIALDLPCPVLQYADDTLLLPADAGQVQRLRQLLDDFAAATGLKINYSKSTMVPMNVSPARCTELQGLLGCKMKGFPQTYLGLPLSATKLNLAAFSPLIAKADKSLAGWQNQFLNDRGHAILINSVLDGSAAYLMAANQMLQGVLDALERRDFLWTGAGKTTGSQCLVAWTLVCQTKEKGVLGVRELHFQNQCLLLKLIHRVHHPGDSAWAQWARISLDLVTLTGRDAVGAHWDALQSLLPFYRCITPVILGDGCTTNFWDDHWHGSETLAAAYPNLASHIAIEGASVSDTKIRGVRRQLVPRRSKQQESWSRLRRFSPTCI